MSISGSIFAFATFKPPQMGTVNIAGNGTAVITFPVAFSSATSYAVFCDSDAATAVTLPQIFAKSGSGFSIKNNDGSAHNFQWFAIGS